MWGKTYDAQSDDKEFKELEKGRYSCVLEDVKIDQSKNGSPFINFTFVIDGGDFNKRKIWQSIYFTDKSYNMAAQQLDNLLIFDNIQPAKNLEAYMNNAADICFKLINKKIEVEVKGFREYNGKKYPNTFITGFLDVPNSAFQNAKKQRPKNNAGFDETEELPF